MIRRTADLAHSAHRLDGVRKQALETGRNRLLVTGLVMTMAFAIIALRLVDLTAFAPTEPHAIAEAEQAGHAAGRADIVDRNGVLLATSLPTASLYADPQAVMDPAEAAAKLVTVLPGLNEEWLRKRLSADGRFVWIKRNLTPNEQYAVNRLGIPGIDFQREQRRVYPHGSLGAHVLGVTDIDSNGISGVERYFDEELRRGDEPLKLSLDVRVQSVLHQELAAAMQEFSAIGAAGVVLDVQTGEMVALVSLPDFDPNVQSEILGDAGFNRVTKGVYEMGSTFKLFTAAMALDGGTVTLDSGYDASKPLRVARYTIRDYHAENRWLSVPEIVLHSSNIGAAKMAVDVGAAGQRDFLGRLGMLQPAPIELPEVGAPLVPSPWREINTMTISFGHGLAVTPLQLVSGIATLVNDGVRVPPTLVAQPAGAPPAGQRVLTAETSRMIRGLMRLVVTDGTGKKADARGYFVGGKTGTAEKQVGGVYKRKARLSSFVAAYPIDEPRYVVLAMLDEPKGTKATFNFATGGWVAAPVVKQVVERTAPMLGIAPKPTAPAIEFDKDSPPAATVRAALRRLPRPPSIPPMKPTPPDAPDLREARAIPASVRATEAPAESPRDRIARQTRAVLQQAFVTR